MCIYAIMKNLAGVESNSSWFGPIYHTQTSGKNHTHVVMVMYFLQKHLLIYEAKSKYSQ